MLRNFPVKMRQMAHTTITGKQNREIQRNNRAARPNVVYEYMEAENCSSRMVRRSAECWPRHGWSMSACDWGFIQWSMDSLHLFASGKGSGRWGSLAGSGRAVSAPVPTDGNSTADVFIKQRKAKISRDVSAQVLGEWHSDARMLLSSCRRWVQTKICVFIYRCVFSLLYDKIDSYRDRIQYKRLISEGLIFVW